MKDLLVKENNDAEAFLISQKDLVKKIQLGLLNLNSLFFDSIKNEWITIDNLEIVKKSYIPIFKDRTFISIYESFFAK